MDGSNFPKDTASWRTVWIQESSKVTEDREEGTKRMGGNEVSLMPGMGEGPEAEGIHFKKEKAIGSISWCYKARKKWYTVQDNSREEGKVFVFVFLMIFFLGVLV